MDAPRSLTPKAIAIEVDLSNAHVVLDLTSWRPTRDKVAKFSDGLPHSIPRSHADAITAGLTKLTSRKIDISRLTTEPTLAHLARLLLDDSSKRTAWLSVANQYVGRMVVSHGRGGADEHSASPIGRPMISVQKDQAPTMEELLWMVHVVAADDGTLDGDGKQIIEQMVDIKNRNHVLEYQVKFTVSGANKYEVSGNTQVHVYRADEDLRMVSAPTSKSPPGNGQAFWAKRSGHVPIVVASPQVERALHALSQAWANPSARSVLLLAPPGSGKEEYVKFLKAGLSPDVSPHSMLMPGLSSEAVNQRLEAVAGRNAFLHVDEVDKASLDDRTRFLRILENKTLHKEDDLADVFFVFTGAATWADLVSREKPVDFWTRMDLVVETAHPLLVGDVDQGFAIRQYVRLFLQRWFEGGNRSRIRALFGIVAESTHDGIAESPDQLVVAISSPLERLCKFRPPSIRTLRTVVNRVLWQLFAHGFAGTGGDWERDKSDSDRLAGVQSPFSPKSDRWVLRHDAGELDRWCQVQVPALFVESCV